MTEKILLKVFGPYICKDGRKRVVFYFNDKSTSSMSYARYLYQIEKGEIDKELTVDHIDENRENDVIENLQPLTRLENIQKAILNGKMKETEWFEGTCVECNKVFIKPMRQIRNNQFKQKKVGPFCSRSCAGKHNQRLQMQYKERVAQLAGGN